MSFPRRFLERVFGDVLKEGDFDIELRCLGARHEKDPMWPEHIWCRGLRELEKRWYEIENHNSLGFDIHYTVLARRREFHGKKEHPLPDPLVVSCLWADLDVGKGKPYKTRAKALQRIRDLKPWPNIIVWSGKGLHVYYLLEARSVGRERFERLLRFLAYRLQGDTGAARASRLMRVPSTHNWKYGKKGKRVKARYLSKTRYKLKDLERLWRVEDWSSQNSAESLGENQRYSNFLSKHLEAFVIRGNEASALCPFHDDRHPSFSINLSNGLWLCRAERCHKKGNIKQLCEKLGVPLPFEASQLGSTEHLDQKLSRPRLSERTLYGLAGDFVRAIEPQSEADPAALLSQLLAAFGNLVGPEPFFRVEATKHHINLFVLVVGASSKARKGTALDHVKRVLSRVSPGWAENQIKTGLSSGEGLIWAVRDYDPRMDKRKNGEIEQLAAIPDKRILVIQPEFASVLRVQRREGNILSSIIRSAWDSVPLQILTKNSPVKATGAHTSIIGHITEQEFRRELTVTDQANGFANRFLTVSAQRSKLLPFGGTVDDRTIDELVKRLKRARSHARKVREMKFSKKARKLWSRIYGRLAREAPGMLGAITSRAEAQVLRLSMVYALLSCTDRIKTHHLKAASALWSYCEQSAAFVFGSSLGNPLADKILRELKAKSKGLTRDQIRELLQHNYRKDEIKHVLELLANSGLAMSKRKHTGGRAAECWVAV